MLVFLYGALPEPPPRVQVLRVQIAVRSGVRCQLLEERCLALPYVCQRFVPYLLALGAGRA